MNNIESRHSPNKATRTMTHCAIEYMETISFCEILHLDIVFGYIQMCTVHTVQCSTLNVQVKRQVITHHLSFRRRKIPFPFVNVFRPRVEDIRMAYDNWIRISWHSPVLKFIWKLSNYALILEIEGSACNLQIAITQIDSISFHSIHLFSTLVMTSHWWIFGIVLGPLCFINLIQCYRTVKTIHLCWQYNEHIPFIHFMCNVYANVMWRTCFFHYNYK